MTSEAKGNYNNGEKLQEALKTGRTFGGGWRKQENKLSLCLGIVGKQQLSYSKANILLFLHTKNTPTLLEAALRPLAVLHDSCKTARLSSLCYVDILCDCYSNDKIERVRK